MRDPLFALISPALSLSKGVIRQQNTSPISNHVPRRDRQVTFLRLPAIAQRAAEAPEAAVGLPFEPLTFLAAPPRLAPHTPRGLKAFRHWLHTPLTSVP